MTGSPPAKSPCCVCREFPYLVSDQRSFGWRMSPDCKHASICPIVFNALESYKHGVGYRLD
jgi:hypothetical protein